MNPKPESFTINLVGQWNKRIFTPAWAGKEIYGKDQIQIEYPLNIAAPQRYSADSIRLIPSSERLIFVSLETTDAKLNQIESMASKVCKMLPYTPVTGVGINFGFIDRNPDADLLKVFSLSDQDALSRHELLTQSYNISRKLSVDSEVLNLSLMLQKGELEIGFNFHYDLKSAAEVEAILNGSQVVSKKSKAISILKNVYSIELEESA